MRSSHVFLLLFVSLFAAALPLFPSMTALENSSIDARFHVRGPVEFKNKVIVVAIDDATADETWQDIPKAFWSSQIAQLCSIARANGAKFVGLDMIVLVDADKYLEARGIAEAPNSELFDEVRNSKGTVFLGTNPESSAEVKQSDPETESETNHLKFADEQYLSITTLQSDRSTIRKLPRWDGGFTPEKLCFAHGLARKDLSRHDPIDINFTGSEPVVISATKLYYSVDENLKIFEKAIDFDPKIDLDPKMFEDAIVLIGETYSLSQDRINTPFLEGESGVMIHAEAIETILSGRELTLTPLVLTIIGCGLLGLASGFIAHRISIGRYVLVAVLLGIAWSASAQWTFSGFNFVFPVVSPLMSFLLISPLCVFAVKAIEEKHERLWARSQWGQMVSDEFVAVLESKRNAGVGTIESFTAVLLFLDVAGFSEKTNRLSSQVVVGGLNRIFEPVIEHINQQGGTVLNFMGDAVMAMFHSSDARGTFHSRAIEAAINILGSVDELNRMAGDSEPWDVRIGMAVGDVNLALVGNKERKQMTVYGSAVNMAARLEQAGKSLGTRLAVSVEFQDQLGDLNGRFVRTSIQPKGWDQEVEVLSFQEPTH